MIDGLHALVVDDEADVREAVRRMIVRHGSVVWAAGSTHEALALLDAHREIEVLLADINMPGADGFALARAALQGRPEVEAIEIVFMTGLGTADNAVAAIRNQAFDFIAKPFRKAELSKIVARARESAAERRRAARRAAAETAARLRAESARASLFSLVSHEFRTPLNPILGLSSLIAESETMPGERARELARSIHAAGSQLLRLVERCLLIVELDSAAPPRLDHDVDVAALAHRVATDRTATASETDQAMQAAIVVRAENAARASCDPALVAMALDELLDNALRASPPELTVRVSCGSQGDCVELRVADDGPGFPERFLAEGPDAFVQADMSEMRAWGGAGLGLALARRIAAAHGGSLSLSNVEGGGACAALKW